jgi:hypothetical protein
MPFQFYGDFVITVTIRSARFMYIGPRNFVIINETKNQLDALSVFYYTYNLHNTFRASLSPSSGALDYIPLFTTWNFCLLGLDGSRCGLASYVAGGGYCC